MILQKYEVYEDTINVQDYFDGMMDELTSILNSFGYESVEAVQAEYGDDANQIIAECIFEHYGSHQANQLMIGTRSEAERAILDFVGGAK